MGDWMRTFGLTAFGPLIVAGYAGACEVCRPSVQAKVYDPDFPTQLALVMIPVAILLGIGAAIHHADIFRVGRRK